LVAAKDGFEVVFVCALGYHRLLAMFPLGVAFGIMAVAVLRLLTLIAIWRLNGFAVAFYLALGVAGVAISAIAHSSIGNPLVAMSCAALIALVFISRWGKQA
jgi:hypothetical protein